MGAMFRSEEMALCQLFIQPEAAYPSVAVLGELGIAQFRDLNPELNSFQRKFTSEVRRCDEMERKLNYIEREVLKDEVAIPDVDTPNVPAAPNPREMVNLEAQLEKTENEIQELSENSVALYQNFIELNELQYVLEKTQAFFSAQEQATNLENVGGVDDGTENKNLGFVAGVVAREKVIGFERMLWRISRGNVFLRQAEIETPFKDPKTGNEVRKTVFVAFFQGEQLKTRVKKVCAGFHASLYPCPNNFEERRDMLKGVRVRLEDLNTVLNQTKDQRQRVLMNVAKEHGRWVIMVKKMKAIYHTLNMFNLDVTNKCLIGECWVPTGDLPNLQEALASGSASVGSSVKSFFNQLGTTDTPPTFNRTNKFTRGFQNLVDSYGVSSYREVNPGLYTIITFPFLFAIMFGDVGHGFLMFLFALWMVLWEKPLAAKKIDSEIWTIFFAGRYIILLMGLFSIFTGFVYNDVFSKTMNIFGTAWMTTYNSSYYVMRDPQLALNPTTDTSDDRIYPIGIDPIWMLATNKILFLNSYKMKMSIIIGVIHMIFGVVLSVVNHRHFKKSVNIILEFVPQMLFLLLLFAYMGFMMFFKWMAYGAKMENFENLPGCSPLILIYFINMMLMGETVPLENCDAFMFTGQGELQTYFVLIALLCIPWLLLAKPLYVMCTRKSKGHVEHAEGGGGGGGEGGHGGHDDEPMSEIFIHQAIHTIEYVLSTVSHTASYLRLWALSLAHAQLSEVLWMQVLTIGTKQTGYTGAAVLFVVFAIWAFFSVAILVMMEGLSAFLHTLRLHWVEFMSKFFEGLGYAFQPFSFKAILDGEEEEEKAA